MRLFSMSSFGDMRGAGEGRLDLARRRQVEVERDIVPGCRRRAAARRASAASRQSVTAGSASMSSEDGSARRGLLPWFQPRRRRRVADEAHLVRARPARSWPAGITLCGLNVVLRLLSEDLPTFQVQFMRYFMGLVAVLPWVFRDGLAAYRTRSLSGQLVRGAVHASGLFLWFAALPLIPFSELIAIGFTSPIFIMIGAVIWLKEEMFWQRWVAGLLGFLGVLVVVWQGFRAAAGGATGAR
jgi:uncharacterized membrane protein